MNKKENKQELKREEYVFFISFSLQFVRLCRFIWLQLNKELVSKVEIWYIRVQFQFRDGVDWYKWGLEL